MISETTLAAGAKTFAPILGQLVAAYLKRTREGDTPNIQKIKNNIKPHLENTFRKCNTIKTLLNPLKPSDFLSIYTTQRFTCERTALDHYGLVDFIKEKEDHVIITGTGGSGKSMFMRYLWISLFENGDGRIPIFYELRNVNSIAQPDLVSLIYHTIIQGKSTLPKREFEKRLKRGDFVVILDGFDEIAHEKRELMQKSIMQLAEFFPGLKIIVTSRPDDRFSSWTTFHVVKVSPLRKIDVLELIEKAEFDREPATRFYKKIQTGDLYETHTSFLSNPLLASMMLLTFSYDFDIPDKMSAFYDQAFDALYKRHDSHKPGGYKREFKTTLTEDTFKRLLSYFALVSYYEQQFEFDNNQIVDFAKKAIRIERIECDPADFIHDLHECVCLIIKDGLTYTFSHRSFQEYFSAYCMSYVTSKNFEKLIQKFAIRPNDQVVPLIADMNPEAFLEGYSLPMSKKYWPLLQAPVRASSIASFMEAMGGTFRVRPVETEEISRIRRELMISFEEEGELANFTIVAQRLSQNTRQEKRKDRIVLDADFALAASRHFDTVGQEDGFITVAGKNGMFVFGATLSRASKARRIPEAPNRELAALMVSSGMYDFIQERYKITKKFAAECISSGNHLDDAMRDVFDFED